MRKKMNMRSVYGFYEFFAGGGMARIGLGAQWSCLYANEWCQRKAASYKRNFDGGKELHVADIASVTVDDLPGRADFAWASFPCQDLSLAGKRAGLAGERSGTFHPFWRLVRDLTDENRRPSIIGLENVTGAITSNGGRDFHALLEVISECGYRVGPLVIDAVHFVPQSRPRLFVVAVEKSISLEGLADNMSSLSPWQKYNLHDAWLRAPQKVKDAWVWWRLPVPNIRTVSLADLIEDAPTSVPWHTAAETEKLIGMMSERNRMKLDAAISSEGRHVGTIYKRTRVENGRKCQRAEVRFDGIGGCLRTPAGGSSRQIVIVIDQGKVRSRLLSTREAARLMGLPDSYLLPESYNEAYHLAGDGVVVPVIQWLEQWLLQPLAARASSGYSDPAYCSLKPALA